MKKNKTAPVRYDKADLPDLTDIYVLAYQTLNSLPTRFQEYTRNILVQVENFADQDALNGLRIADKYDLLGLYQGIPLPLKAHKPVQKTPDTIFLYRCPLILFARENSDTLIQLVHHVMIHEIGHHFGFSDFDLEWIEQKRE